MKDLLNLQQRSHQEKVLKKQAKQGEAVWLVACGCSWIVGEVLIVPGFSCRTEFVSVLI